jgi:hypothetical protein
VSEELPRLVSLAYQLLAQGSVGSWEDAKRLAREIRLRELRVDGRKAAGAIAS